MDIVLRRKVQTAAVELVLIATLLLSLGLWTNWLFALPREQALARASAWSHNDCAALSVIPWQKGQRFARCAPFGTVQSNPVGFAALSAGVVMLVIGCVFAARRRRAAFAKLLA